ncbi:MAG: peptide/nickel transport system permease protein [Chloroflexota bacterium]|nr:peptide/nickel transport system permease protein [Chloroflexota bacterium]
MILLALALAALLAPVVAPFPQDALNTAHVEERLLPPDGQHLFGTDELGRDVLSRVLFGGRLSLVVGAISMLLSATVGTAVGLVSGYAPGWLEELLMRLADVFLGIPPLVLAIIVSLVFGGGLEISAVAIAASAWPRYARLVRGEVLRIKVLEFVEAARAYGAPSRIILLRHIFPGIQPVLTVQAALQVGNAILVVAALGFIGLGARPPSPEWGLAIATGREYLPESWWISVFPGAFIFFTVIALSLLSDGLQRAMDTRLANT